MIKTRYEIKTYTKTEKVMVSEKRYCDICGEEITGSYYEIMTGHHDWGNDSCDSIEHKDACSVKCLNDIFSQYCERAGKGRDNTEYIEIDHCRWADVKGEITYD